MRTTAMILAATLAILAMGGATAAERAGGAAAGNAVLSGDVFATGGGGINGANQAVPVAGASYAPLTAAECKGLGGKVVASTGCSANFGTDVCVTVGSDGVVHKVCLSK